MRARGSKFRGVVALGVVTGGLLFGVAPALAAAPEAPEVEVEQVNATSATFHGVLNPIEAAEPNNKGGGYKYLYKASKTECTGGSITKPSGLWHGEVHEELPGETVAGLDGNTEYMVCLSVTNLEGETTVSAPVAFRTAIAPEEPKTAAASSTTGTSTKLEGTLNPHSSRKAGGHFAYSNPGGSSCLEGPTASPEELEGEKEEEAIAVHTTATGLEPNAKYRACLVATDELGDTTHGNEVSFTTQTLAPAEEGLTASSVTPFAATLEAQVNPENEPTECKFEYGPAKAVKLEKEVACEQGATPGTLEGYGNQTASANVKLASDTTYYYRLIVKNATGKAEGESQLKTLAVAKAVVEGETATGITTTDAMLEAQVNPNYQETTYTFEYAASEAALLAGHGTRLGGGTIPAGFGNVPAGPVDIGNGLSAGTTYYYRLVATNAKAETTDGAVASFATTDAPLVTTREAENIESDTTELFGTVNPEGLATAYHFLYVPADEYEPAAAEPYAKGTATPERTSAGAGHTAYLIAAGVGGLIPDETYDYTEVATNALGVVTGSNQTFTTAPAPAAPPTPGTGAGGIEPTPPATATPPAVFPLMTYTSIAQLDAQEAKEGKATNPPTTRSLTRVQKLSKALKVCNKRAKGRRAACERVARKRYGLVEKSKKR